jgi:hydroxyacylglutathione hydrolase
MQIDPGPEPTMHLSHGQKLPLGDRLFEVRHTPGHTPGHVVFYCGSEKVVFCGDVIFWGGIGRTDLPGGDYDTLMHSIQSQILSLPNDTRLLSGHGGETTVGYERRENPFLS